MSDKLKLVPAEPDQLMCQAGQEKAREWPSFPLRITSIYKAMLAAAPTAPLMVWYGSMPESNGKSNWTAILHRGDISEGFTIDRSEYPDRVRYEADRVRYLIGETEKDPWILDYDADKRSSYVPRDATPTRYGYVYEWDYSPGVVHRSFNCAPYNGRQPDRTIEVFGVPMETKP